MKKIKKEKNVNVIEKPTTPPLPTTTYYIKSWGYFNLDKKIIIEQITTNWFLYNINGKKGLVEVIDIPFYKKRGFIVEDILFLFDGRIYNAPMFYNIPSWHDAKAYVDGKMKPVRPYCEIQQDIIKVLKEMFDFSVETDIAVTNIHIAQSWIKPIRNESFFYGLDATKGGGKTTLGEIVYFLMRHGFVGGNISPGALVRLVHELDLSVFVDELDQKSRDEDLMGIMRQGQRRGNPYVRCEGRDNHPESYEAFGCHGYSYRSEIEDAFADRSLRIHTEKSLDHRLPIINTLKKQVLKPLADELFFWFIENILVVGCSKQGRVAMNLTPKQFNRNSLFIDVTADFGENEQKLLSSVFGRDSELTFLSLQTAKLLGLDIVQDLRAIMEKKKADSASSENVYYDSLKEHIYTNQQALFCKTLSDGIHAGCPYYPKNRLYKQFNISLSQSKIQTIGTKKFSSMIRDLGFVEGISLTSQRYDGYPTACLIFTKDIVKSLGINMEDYSK